VEHYTDISCLGGVFAKNTNRETKISRAEWRGKFSFKTGIFRKYPSLPFLPFAETLVTKFVKRYQLCVLCNIISVELNRYIMLGPENDKQKVLPLRASKGKQLFPEVTLSSVCLQFDRTSRMAVANSSTSRFGKANENDINDIANEKLVRYENISCAFYVTIVFAVFTLRRDACNKICKTLSVVRFM
jgi:hypothetical protein